MKRAATSSPPPSRPAKLARIDYFDPSCEIRDVSTLAERDTLDESAWFAGRIEMAFPLGERVKLRVISGGAKLSVALAGPASRKLLPSSNIKLSLRGATLKRGKVGAGLLPFTLEYGERLVVEQKGTRKVARETVTFEEVLDSWSSEPTPARAADEEQSSVTVRQHEASAAPAVTLATAAVGPPAAETALAGVSSRAAIPSPPIALPAPAPANPEPTNSNVTPKSPRIAAAAATAREDSSQPLLNTVAPPAVNRPLERSAQPSPASIERAQHRPVPTMTPGAGSSRITTPATSPSKTKSPVLTGRSPKNVESHAFDYVTCKAAKAASVNRRLSIIGVVVSCTETKATRTGEYCRIFHLTDESLDGSATFVVQCFNKTEAYVPNIRPGQVILLRYLRVGEWQKEKRGTGYKDSLQWVAYDPEEGEHFVSDPMAQRQRDKHFPFVQPTPEEIARFIELSDWWREKSEGGSDALESIVAPKPGREIIELKDVREKVFFDCIVEVIDLRQPVGANYTILRATDYTPHDLNQEIPNAKRPHPPGKFEMKFTVWEEQQEVPIQAGGGHYYELRNVRPKVDPEGFLDGNISGKLSAGCYISPVEKDDPRLEELLKRREAFWDAIVDVPPPTVEPVEEPVKPRMPRPQHPPVICENLREPLYTIREMVESEHITSKFRIKGQIVEFFPHDPKDFVDARCKQCREPITDKHLRNCTNCGDDMGRFTEYTWRFCLRVRDEDGDEVNVNVAGEHARQFLNTAPCHLTDNPDTLTKLRANLEKVVGNVLEVHELLDEDLVVKVEPGPAVNLCVMSWLMDRKEDEEGRKLESVRMYNLFGCRISS